MPATEQLTIILPKELAEAVRARVASGEYESESEFFCANILQTDADHFSDKGWGPSDEWLTQHALPALDELEADPSSGVPIEKVEEELQRRRDLRQ